jgi:glutamine amidotransferase
VAGSSVHIVDCSANNLASVVNAFRAAGASPEIARTPEDVLSAERLVLPGVGSAAHAAAHLASTGIGEALTDRVRRQGRPLLAICVGMQVLAERLREHGDTAGLGWLPGEVRPLRDLVAKSTRVPHMGWTTVAPVPAFAGSLGKFWGSPTYFFCHSFTLATPRRDAIAATVDLGAEIVAALRFDTVLGTQFHPERSHVNGLRLIEAFLDWSP